MTFAPIQAACNTREQALTAAEDKRKAETENGLPSTWMFGLPSGRILAKDERKREDEER